MSALEIRNDPRKIRRYVVIAFVASGLSSWVALEGLSATHRAVGLLAAIALGVGALLMLRGLVFPPIGYEMRVDDAGIDRNGNGWQRGCLTWDRIVQVGLVERQGSAVLFVRVSSAEQLSKREQLAASMFHLPRDSLPLLLGGMDVKPDDVLQFIRELHPDKVAPTLAPLTPSQH